MFVADCMWVALQIFEQFCSKSGNANSLVAEPETDFNAKWPFKVVYFGVTEEPLRDYIAKYYGLRCKGSEDIAGEISENRHFRRPHSHLKPRLQRTHAC